MARKKGNGTHRIYMGADMFNAFTAAMSGDTKRLREIEADMERKKSERRAVEYAFLNKNLPTQAFAVFKQIDSTYQRHVGWTNDAQSSRGRYAYTWTAKDVRVSYEDYGTFDLMINFSASKFGLYIYYCDETGYDQGRHTIESDIDPSQILEKISALRNGTQPHLL